jgi:hypothetical protein
MKANMPARDKILLGNMGSSDCDIVNFCFPFLIAESRSSMVIPGAKKFAAVGGHHAPFAKLTSSQG